MDATATAWSFALIPAVVGLLWVVNKIKTRVADHKADKGLNSAIMDFEVQQHAHPALRGARQVHTYQVTVPRRLMLLMGLLRFPTTETTRWYKDPTNEDSEETEESV